MSVLTIGEVVRRSTTYLAERGSASARLDAELLIGHALGLARLHLYTESERPLEADELEAVRALLKRRARREPVAYILGTRAFRSLTLAVGPAVLVPRPETEILVEWALQVAPAGAAVLDWGTGSGAIAIALATEGEGLAVCAVDRSPEALAVARANAESAGAAVEFVESDGFAALAGRRFSLIAANPPYLSDDDLRAAPPELTFEPRGALVAGPEGLEDIARICAQAPDHLEPAGWLLVEVGEGQAQAALALMAEAGFTGTTARADLAGIARTVGGRLP